MNSLDIILDIMTKHRTELINKYQIETKNGYKCGEGWMKLYHAHAYLVDQAQDTLKRLKNEKRNQ